MVVWCGVVWHVVERQDRVRAGPVRLPCAHGCRHSAIWVLFHTHDVVVECVGKCGAVGGVGAHVCLLVMISYNILS